MGFFLSCVAPVELLESKMFALSFDITSYFRLPDFLPAS